MLIMFLKMTFRLMIGFISLIAYMRIHGMMQLAPQSATDQIGNYVLGGIIGGIIYDTELPLWQFFMAIVIWGSLSLISYYIRDKNLQAKRVIDGEPMLLMDKGELHIDAFQKAKVSADDLMSRLHQQGISSLSELQTIWLETNGQLTLVSKNAESLAYVFIEDGQINKIDLRRSSKNKEWLERKISEQGYHKINEIFCAEYVKGELFIYPYKNK